MQRVSLQALRMLSSAVALSCFQCWLLSLATLHRISAASPQTPELGATTLAAPTTHHWAFQRIGHGPPPEISNHKQRQWIQSPIDRFILAGLNEKNLEPAPPADKRTLIRRATFDLIGLPPTPEEIADFLSDRSPHAFAKVVDRLLASPRYGERWGRHWLDVARYSDSNGLDENLVYAHAWRYRDYVIAAFNQDKPYDQFIHEQLAGDLLPNTDDEARKYERLIATSFLALGAKMLAEDDPTKMEMDIVDEQVDTVGRAFMGLTIGCARCHDHKFDPIPTADYYSLAGIFKSSKTMENFKVVAVWHEHVLASEQAQERLKSHKQLVADKKAEVERRTRAANDLLLSEARRNSDAYLLAATTLLHSERTQASNSTPETSPKPAQESTTSSLNADILKQWTEHLRQTRNETNSIFYPWHTFIDDATEPRDLSSLARILFRAPKPSAAHELAARYQELFEQAEQSWRELLKSRKETGGLKLADGILEEFRNVLCGVKGPFALPANASKYYSPETASELKRLNEETKTLEAATPVLPKAMGIKEGTVTNLSIHLRGNYLTLGREAPRRFLQIVSGADQTHIDNQRSGRVELARWLTSEDHPLTSRVMVNRIWRGHFGAGLVRSVDNFGQLGESPSNPALLDWLAKQFIESGWSIKAMHRLIMLSCTYQMSSAFNAKAALVDPENHLHWRKDRWRLEAEAIRDAIFAVSGQLDLSMGGSLLKFKEREYVTSTANRDTTPYDVNLRSIYLPVIRSAVYDVFLAFDFSDPSVSNGDRATTTVAPQALFAMNSGIMLKQSQKMAGALMRFGEASDAERVRIAYEHSFGRLPDDQELHQALAFVKRAAAALEPYESDVKKRHGRAWQSFCRTLLASNEFIYVE